VLTVSKSAPMSKSHECRSGNNAFSDSSYSQGVGVNSWIGWTTITRAELAAAQQVNQLADRGVRDEIGVSAIDFLYAERFFPGTSVQLTRLRYIFFVAGLYELLRRKPAPMDLNDAVAQAERRTAFQLLAWHSRHHKELEGSGIIGRTIVHAHAPVLLPSMSYWTPLSRWGVLAPSDAGSPVPSRAAVHGDWNRYRRRKGHPGEVDTRTPLFHLELETHWEDHIGGDLRAVGDGRTPLTFELTHWERPESEARTAEPYSRASPRRTAKHAYRIILPSRWGRRAIKNSKIS
jgi:hypothetical protein